MGRNIEWPVVREGDVAVRVKESDNIGIIEDDQQRPLRGHACLLVRFRDVHDGLGDFNFGRWSKPQGIIKCLKLGASLQRLD